MKKNQLIWLLPFLTLNFQLHASEDNKSIEPSYRASSNKVALKKYNTENKDEVVLSPVTVTGSSTIQDELSSPKSVSIYTREDIKRSGVTNLMDFFKNFTEIQAETNFGNTLNPQISMRGFGNGTGYQNINVIVDGVSLNQIDLVPQQLGSVPVDSIEKIEVVKNDGTVVYGDNAAAGTIIIRTNNSFERKPLYGSVRSSFGTYDTTLTSANFGSVTDFKGFKVLADGKFTFLNTDGKKTVLSDDSKDSTENVNGRATLGLQKDNLEVLTSFIKDDAHVTYNGNMTLDAFNQNPNSAVTTGQRNIVHKEDWSTALKYKINDRFNLSYTYGNKTKDSKFPDFAFTPHYEGEDHRLTLQTLQDDFVILAGFEHSDNARTTSNETTAKENIAGFISGDYFVNDRLSLNAGFRQAFITFRHDDRGINNHLSKTVNPNSYNIAANYSLDNTDALFASYVHAFQSPDIDRFFVTNFFTVPPRKTFNFAINSMEMDTYAIGYKHIEDNLRVKAEFFYSDLNNEIYFDSNQFINTNFDNSEKYGINLSLFKDIGWFHASINYLYTATRAKLGSAHVEISAQPKHIVLATIGKEFTCQLLPLPYHTVSLTHKYQSESFPQDDFDNTLGRQQNYNATTFNYQVSDHKHWTVDFSILNLFDGHNGQFVDFGASQSVAYPTNYQRTFQGSVSYRF
ncbi:TonB-dependent receptor [Methyloglobulus sp.]|uniref:TonB-dependent receptor plug domain-containing protein n=1 Tax=Methyloglobulus sp. TaxID=2518622 RepID=UPI0032B823E8